MSNSIAPGSSADINVKVTALTTNPNVPVTYKTIILKKNLVNGVNTLTQEMMSAANTKYVIKYNYILCEDITVPADCILEFDGGSISGSNILTYTNTSINGSWEKSINCVCTGTVANDIVNPLMYGAHINSITEDSSAAIQAAINNNKKVEFTKGTYIIDYPIVIYGDYYNIDFSFSTLKKTSNTTYNYTYENVKYQDAAIIVYKPGSDYTLGYSILSNLIIDGVNKTNNITGIIIRNNRNITLNNIRIDRCKTGCVFGGFLNTYNKITCNDCELGFELRGLMYSIFTKCFNAVPNNDGRGYLIINCRNIEFNSCSSDNATNAAYYAINSKISLINCSCEVKTLCIFGNNSIITIVGGHFECYQYNSPNPLKYVQLDSSKLYAKGTFFHWANYGSLATYEESIQIAATNSSYVDIEGTIEYVEGLKILIYSADSLYINGVKAPHTSPITLPIATIGNIEERPTLNDNDCGFKYYDIILRKNITWSGVRWEDTNGFPAIPTVGTTENRPTGIGSGGVLDNNKDKGFCYFDTNLGKPIYATLIYDNGSVDWIDATGASV